VDFSKLERCVDLKGDHIAAAVQSPAAIAALAKRFGEIAKPNSGGTLLLAALARLATKTIDWIDGELRIELVADGAKTKIVASSSIGGGFREALFPTVILDVPLAEFARTIEKSPKVIEPMKKSMTGSRIVLTASEEVRMTSLPPPMIQIDASSLLDVPKLPKLKSPFELDEAAPMVRPRKETLKGVQDPRPPSVRIRKKSEPAVEEPALVLRKKSEKPPAPTAKTKPPPAIKTKPPPKVPRPSPKK
jgi:hypothetical protein